MKRLIFSFFGFLLAICVLIIPNLAFGQETFFGVYRASVINVDDPLMRGRIRVMVPAVYGDQPSAWALPSFAFAGADHGLILVPEVGDGVWIQFENGDSELPIWIGAFLTQAAPVAGDPAKTRSLVTSQGHKIILNEVDNVVEIGHADGPSITLREESILLNVGATTLSITPLGVFVNGEPISKAIFCNGFENCPNQ